MSKMPVMTRSPVLATAALLALLPGLLMLPSGPAAAGTLVWVPSGTKVPLAFITPVDSGKITEGTKVYFKVNAPVVGGRHVVINAGARAGGTVTKVTKPGMFGASSKVVIGFITVPAVDGRPISLTDVIVSKAMVSNSRAGAAGASVAGAVVLGPVGLLAGALVKGSYVSVPAGTRVVDTTSASASVRAQ